MLEDYRGYRRSSSSAVMQLRDEESGCMQMEGGSPWKGTVFGRLLER